MSHDLSFFKAKPSDAIRIQKIDKHPFRDEFQRDRDRILYSKEFRRLSGKTQIFVTGIDDHMRTRLTHTLEVAQIAETISQELGLNTMLTTAIAYGHDIGHTPFGHIGERTLNYIMNGCFEYYNYNIGLKDDQKGFRHNLQGVRVASFLEETNDDERSIPLSEHGDIDYGLNLTTYTLWGILNHTKLEYGQCEYYHDKGGSVYCGYKNKQDKEKGESCKGRTCVGFYKCLYQGNNAIIQEERDWSLEGIIVSYADEIAQRHHDIEDGIYAGLINIKQLCDYIVNDKRFDKNLTNRIEHLIDTMADISQSSIVRKLSRYIVDSYVTTYIESIYKIVKKQDSELSLSNHPSDWKAILYEHIKKQGKTLREFFGYDIKMQECDNDFQQYLVNHILYSEQAQSMDGRAAYIIIQLIKAYLTNPQQLPGKTIIDIVKECEKKGYTAPDAMSSYMTKESLARNRLKEIMVDNQHDHKVILLRKICDYIAGMTDQYAISCFNTLYGIK